ncbi:MAG: hypothetical protein HQ581_23830 [Planctomycetes bacterium]|nr:hypothetical protein [Planctomycetota bacterium]
MTPRSDAIHPVLSAGRLLLVALGLVVPAQDRVSADEEPSVAAESGAVPGTGYRLLGKIKLRHAREIQSSNWSIGAETMDRDYTIYKHWREYLGPLGIKKARIQSGWAKTEKRPGQYDWQWLDEIIFDMVDQGVEPWVCLCYGNPIYPGGGDTGLGGGMIQSEEAFAAWDRYVAAAVDRYKRHVDEWELWNEPRTGRGKGAVEYGKFVARTANVIRARQPAATVIIAAGGAFDAVFAAETLTWLRDQGEISLVDQVAYHPYSANPDASYGKVAELRKAIGEVSPRIKIRQGENGCPSAPGGFGALGSLPWTESAQAKWSLRRLLGDLGRDIPSSYFAICDMQYPNRVNYKGLLKTNPDKTVSYRKPAYYAVGHVAAIFDDTLTRVKDFKARIDGKSAASRFAIFGYTRGDVGWVVTLWRSDSIPGKRSAMEHITVLLPDAEFREPVWVDLLSGRVYSIDDTFWMSGARGTVFGKLPVHDSAVVIAERSAIANVVTPTGQQP